MTQTPDILCIGSVLWDVIGRAPQQMRLGSDVPGRIWRLPGGVAFNIAMTLAGMGLRPALLSVVGRDADGKALVAACEAMGCDTGYVYHSDDLPTDRYMAIEGANGLIAAIADAHSLEAAGARILHPLTQGPLGDRAAPYDGIICLDGNLTSELLTDIAYDVAFAKADLRLAPASPGKAERLSPFVATGRGTLYVNLEEAGLLCDTRFDSAPEAARALLAKGAARALVTNGALPCCEADATGERTAAPPQVTVARITGAGDTFMAAHIVAEHGGAPRDAALHQALNAAAQFVSGKAAT